MIRHLFLLLASLCALSYGSHLLIGDVSNKALLFQTNADYSAIPFIRREKDIFYNNDNQKLISAISAYDNQHSRSTAIVTAGGINFTYVNIRLTSERGSGLDYDIAIFTYNNNNNEGDVPKPSSQPSPPEEPTNLPTDLSTDLSTNLSTDLPTNLSTTLPPEPPTPQPPKMFF